MRELGKFSLILSILVVAGLVVMMDIVIMPIFLEIYPQTSSTSMFVIDFIIVLLAGLAGVFFAPRVSCPFWWRGNDSSPKLRERTLLAVTIGLAIVMLNTLNTLSSIDQAMQSSPWLALLTPQTAVALSFRAALNEEVIFRLFLFPLVAWIFKHLRSSETALIIGALVSSIVAGFTHGSGFFWVVPVSLGITYIYYQRGLLPAMTVHFFADAIQFVLISIML